MKPKELKALQEIYRLTLECPCMSRQAQKDFERCKEADAYRVELAGVIIRIREQAAAAINGGAL